MFMIAFCSQTTFVTRIRETYFLVCGDFAFKQCFQQLIVWCSIPNAGRFRESSVVISPPRLAYLNDNRMKVPRLVVFFEWFTWIWHCTILPKFRKIDAYWEQGIMQWVPLANDFSCGDWYLNCVKTVFLVKQDGCKFCPFSELLRGPRINIWCLTLQTKSKQHQKHGALVLFQVMLVEKLFDPTSFGVRLLSHWWPRLSERPDRIR